MDRRQRPRTYLARESRNVLGIWKMVCYSVVLQCEGQHLLGGECVVLGRIQVLNLLVLNGLLAPRHNVFHEVNVDRLVGGQVEAAVYGEEAMTTVSWWMLVDLLVYLLLAAILGGELLGGDPGQLLLVVDGLYHD